MPIGAQYASGPSADRVAAPSARFSAETLAVLIIELAVGIIALRQTMELWVAVLLLSLFPVSIVFIAGLEAIGLD